GYRVGDRLLLQHHGVQLREAHAIPVRTVWRLCSWNLVAVERTGGVRIRDEGCGVTSQHIVASGKRAITCETSKENIWVLVIRDQFNADVKQVLCGRGLHVSA